MDHLSTINIQERQEFLSTDVKSPLVVHWDGKMMRDGTNLDDPKTNVDRLAVCVTGRNIEKILGIVKITSGTGHGQAQANATFQLLNVWEVSQDIIGLSFDTTASNTGSVRGACVLLEKQMQRNLYFACRHHIHELIIGEVFSVLLDLRAA